jgi:hypothetical protein
MAKQNVTPVTPSFKDVDKEATQRAQAAIAGGQQKPLKAPKGAKSDASKGVTYTRWTERVTIQSAYRSTTQSNLLDAVVIVKVRQSKENTGEKVFGHFYLNLVNPSEKPGHEEMNDRSNGAIISLLVATGQMPVGGTLKGSLLDRMFPSKGQPGVTSPLNNKSVIANIMQTYGPKKDKNKKPMLGEDKKPIMEHRDNIESFLPDTAATPAASDEGDEGEE